MKKVVILFAVLLSIQFMSAQEKCQYMQISYNTLDRYINVSNGDTYKFEKVAKSEGDFDANPLLRKIAEFQDQGWELTDREMILLPGAGLHNEVCFCMNAYLRKKK